MEIIRLNGNAIKPKTIAAIGFFDGVHRAHHRLLESMKTIAKTRGLHTAVITFDVHPRSVLLDVDYRYITPLEHKIECIRNHDIETLYLIAFDEQKATTPPQAFIETYLNHFEVIVCGFDFRFGNKANGTVSTLKEHGQFESYVVEEMTHDGEKIGSTQIRKRILEGRVDTLKPMLGEYYSIRGPVIHGEKQGKKIGYPTANIDTGEYLVPKTGVYAALTRVDDIWHESMASIGFNPTLNKANRLSVESYIFDFDQNIYGKTIEIRFVKWLRNEMAFDSPEALIKQIGRDAIATKKLFKI